MQVEFEGFAHGAHLNRFSIGLQLHRPVQMGLDAEDLELHKLRESSSCSRTNRKLNYGELGEREVGVDSKEKSKSESAGPLRGEMPEVVASSGSTATILPKWPHFSLPPTSMVSAASLRIMRLRWLYTAFRSTSSRFTGLYATRPQWPLASQKGSGKLLT